jgi:hypothetical protein
MRIARARLSCGMRRISTLDLLRHFGVHCDEAMSKPVIVTKTGRDRLVLISIEQYQKMRRAFDALSEEQRRQLAIAPQRRGPRRTQ